MASDLKLVDACSVIELRQGATVQMMARRLFAYELPTESVTFLISMSMNGSPERQLAAKLLLECLRRCETVEEIQACMDEVQEHCVLDIAPELKNLAGMVGVISQTRS
jgi:hypothetical protein